MDAMPFYYHSSCKFHEKTMMTQLSYITIETMRQRKIVEGW